MRINQAVKTLVLSGLLLCLGSLSSGTAQAVTTTNQQINFQGRLLNSQGAIVADGTYNMEFKIYQGGTGTAVGDPDGTLEWTEDWVYGTGSPDNRVTVANGYFSVQLGSITSLSSVDFSKTTLWLSVNIGNVSTAATFAGAAGDGEMLPMKRLSASPYALNSDLLDGLDSSQVVQLGQGLQPVSSSGSAISINQTGSGSLLQLQKNGSNAFVVDNTGNLQASGTGTNYIMGSLGLGTVSPQAGSALTLANSSWISGVANGGGYVNLLQVNSNNELQVGTALNIDGGIILPTDGGQMTLSDLPVDASASAGTKESYTLRVGSTNALTVYGESDGAGSIQNVRVAVGSSIAPAYTLDVGGDVNTSGSYRFTNSSHNLALSSATLTANQTITLPNTTGTVCLQGSSACGFMTGSGQAILQGGNAFGAAVQVGSTDVQWTQLITNGSARLSINSTGDVGIGMNPGSAELSVKGLNTQPALIVQAGSSQTADLFDILNSAGNPLDTFSKNGDLLIGGTNSAASTTAFKVQNSSSAGLLTADTQNMRVSVGSIGTATGQLYVSGTVPTDVSSGGATTGSYPQDVAVSGHYAYVVDRNANKLQVFDISNPSTPTDISSGGATTGSGPQAVAISGRYAYVADNNINKFQVFDISNPSTPTDVSSGGVSLGSGQPNAVAISGRYAYVTDDSNLKLLVFDISNPAKPIDISSGGVSVSGTPYAVAISGRYAYVTDGANKLQVFDISNPSTPTDVSSGGATTGSYPQDVAISGRYAYVTDHNTNKLQVFDISSPMPVDVSSGGVSLGSGQPDAITISGRYAYVTDDSNLKLLVFDISNPATPTDISSGGVSVSGTPYAVAISGRYAYVTDGANKLQAFDLGGAYIQQLQAGSTETGGLQVDNNASFAGDAGIQGGLTVGQSVEVSGNIGASGQLLLQNTTNSTAALQAQNSSGVALFNVDTVNGRVGIGALNAPGSLQTSTATTGGTIAASTTYYYKVTAVDATGGESVTSTEASKTTGSGTSTNTITATWNAVPGAVGYNVYRGTSSGGENVVFKTAASSFVDTGLAGSNLTSLPLNGSAYTLQLGATGSYLQNTTIRSNLDQGITYIQQGNTSSISGTAPTATLSSGVKPGDALILQIGIGDNITSVTSVSGGGVTWIRGAAYSDALNGGPFKDGDAETWYGLNSTGTTGSTTITVHLSGPGAGGTAYDGVIVSEWSGIGGVDQSLTNYVSDNVDPLPTPTVAPNVAGELITAMINTFSSGTFTSPSNGYTALPQAGSNNGFAYYIDPTTSASYTTYPSGHAPATAEAVSFVPKSTVFNVQNTAGASLLAADTQNMRVSVGSIGTATGQLYVSGSLPTAAVKSIATTGSTWSLAAAGNVLYGVNNGTTFQEYNISQPANPTALTTLTLGTQLNSVAIQGRYAYVSDIGTPAFYIVDIANPKSPSLTSTTATAATTTNVIASGRYAYAMESNGNIQIFDVSNPAKPFLRSTFASGASQSMDAYLRGKFLYIVVSNGLRVFDISDSANPVPMSAAVATASTNPQGPVVIGGYAYVYNYTSTPTLQVFDVSDPGAAGLVATVPLTVGSGSASSNSPQMIQVQGRFAYVANDLANTLDVVDISNPAAPVLVGGIPTNSHPIAVGTLGRYAYVESFSANTIQAFDLGGAYVQQLQAGGTETGTLQVDNNAGFAADVSIQGGLAIGQSLQANGNVGIAGMLTTSNINASTGSSLTIAGGAGASGNSNGNNLVLSGGEGSGTGVGGLVVMSTPTFQTAGPQTCAVNCTITQANIDGNGAVIVGASTSGLTITLSNPTITTAGRVVYVTAANGSSDFTLQVNGGGTGNQIAMRQNTSATMIWSGSAWTAAGASSSTTLQAAYDNTLVSAGGAELLLSHTSNTNGLTMRDSLANPVSGPLVSVQSSSAAQLFSVSSNVTEYSSDGGAEVQGATSSTFPASTWSAIGAATVSRFTTVGNFVATGIASVQTTTPATAGTGVKNILSSALVANTHYNVSFAARLSSGALTNMSVYYSVNGTASSVACVTGQAITTSVWTKVNCSFAAPASGITSSNAILITQGNAVAHTFYIDNISVTIAADYNYATDGGVDNQAGFSTNWPALGTPTTSWDSTTGNDTSDSAKIVTAATAGQGIKNVLSINPLPNTLYRVSAYAKLNSGTFTDFSIGYSPDDGGTGGGNFQACVDYNTQTLSTSGWTQITCYINTSAATVSAPRVYFYQATGTARTFWVDTFSMTLSANTTPNVQIGGGVTGGPVTLFTLDRAAAAPIASNNSNLLGSMYYDTTLGKLQCYEADGWGACGSSPDNIVTISPEFTNAVMHGTGVGTMTSDLCSGTLGINDGSPGQASICGANETYNFYKWTSPQATSQTYSIYVTYQLPDTLKGFSSGSTYLMGRTDAGSSGGNATVAYTVYKNDPSSGLTTCGSMTVSTGTSASWSTVAATGTADPSTCGFAPGDSIVFKIDVTANKDANAYVGNIGFTFSNK